MKKFFITLLSVLNSFVVVFPLVSCREVIESVTPDSKKENEFEDIFWNLYFSQFLKEFATSQKIMLDSRENFFYEREQFWFYIQKI